MVMGSHRCTNRIVVSVDVFRIFIGSQERNPALCAYNHVSSFTFNKCTAYVKGERFIFWKASGSCDEREVLRVHSNVI
jgi:hypothetical protein